MAIAGPWHYFLGLLRTRAGGHRKDFEMMNSLNWKPLHPLLAAAVMGFSAPAFAIDLLELPAVQSNAASRALLLDAANRGNGSLAAVGTHGVIIVSGDNGQSWTQASVPASVTLTGIHFPTPEKGWAVGHDGLILHSADGGQTWEKQLDGHQLNEQIVTVAERIVGQVSGVNWKRFCRRRKNRMSMKSKTPNSCWRRQSSCSKAPWTTRLPVRCGHCWMCGFVMKAKVSLSGLTVCCSTPKMAGRIGHWYPTGWTIPRPFT